MIGFKNTGLSFILIACIFFKCSDSETIRVGIQPIENFDQALTDTISNAINKMYGVDVFVLPKIQMPKEAFVNIKTPRYRADKIIRIMKETKPDSLDYILCLTDQDISTTKSDWLGKVKEPKSKYVDWGVFGLGYRPGPACVVSSFRLKNTTRVNFIERLKKVSVHELGHNLGLRHCESRHCVMTDAAEKISTIDQEEMILCESCKKQLGIQAKKN